MGFMEAGFDIVFANEYDKVFADLHDEGIREWCIGHKKKFCPISGIKLLKDSLKILFILFLVTLPPCFLPTAKPAFKLSEGRYISDKLPENSLFPFLKTRSKSFSLFNLQSFRDILFYAESLWRPLLRRRRNTFLPERVFILFLKP